MEKCCEVGNRNDSKKCSVCAGNGTKVSSRTITSLVKEERLKALNNFDNFYFCNNTECNVVYYDNEDNLICFKEDVKVRVGIKEKEEPIPLCYCFGWTQEKIYEQIRQMGKSTAVEEITAKVKAGKCSCETSNPQGKCCLGNVNATIKKGMEVYGSFSKETFGSEKTKTFAMVGALLSGLLASFCCIGPAIVTMLGIGSATIFSKIAVLRPFFLVLALLLLGYGYYITFFKRRIVCENGICGAKRSSLFSKLILGIGTFIVLGFVLFPYIPTRKLKQSSYIYTQSSDKVQTVKVKIEGMTCSSCAYSIEKTLAKLDGVVSAKVSFEDKNAEVVLAENKANSQIILQTIAKLGYSGSITK